MQQNNFRHVKKTILKVENNISNINWRELKRKSHW